MAEFYYTLGPLSLQLRCSDQGQAQQIIACWQQLFRITATPPRPAIALSLTSGPTLDEHFTSDLVEEQGEARYGAVRYWCGRHNHWIGCGESLVRIARGAPVVEGHLDAAFWRSALVEQREFFLRIFFLLARGQGMHILHANALVASVADPQSGVLLAGACGAGKTTLTLSLVRAGWRYVSDDSVLLAPADGGVDAHAVRRGFACTLTSAAQWPELAALAATALPLTRTKVLLQPEQYYPAAYQPTCHPRVLLFPQVAHLAQSRLTALTEMETFLQLLAQPRSSLLIDPATTPSALAIFQGLAGQCRGYALELGMDVYRAPAQVADLLAWALP